MSQLKENIAEQDYAIETRVEQLLRVPETLYVLVNSRRRIFSFVRTCTDAKCNTAACEVGRWLAGEESALICFLCESDALAFCRGTWVPEEMSFDSVRAAAMDEGHRGLLVIFRNEERTEMLVHYVR